MNGSTCRVLTKPDAILSCDELATDLLMERINARIREAVTGISDPWVRRKMAARAMDEVLAEAKSARRSGPR